MAISRKFRFEIFKRDGFTCRYCGNKPPSVVLEVDHIVPVCNGGGDDSNNLVCSCFDCNRGKGKHALSDTNLAELLESDFALAKEKLNQLKAYYETLSKEAEFMEFYTDALDRYWWDDLGEMKDFCWKEKRRSNIRRMLKQSDFYFMRDCMALAFSTKPFWQADEEKLWKYFCGIFWNRIKYCEDGGSDG